MLSMPPLQRRQLGVTLLISGLLVGLPRAWAALDPAPGQADRVALGGPQVRVLLREAPVLTVRAPAGGRLRLRDGAGQVLMELGPEQSLRLQLAGAHDNSLRSSDNIHFKIQLCMCLLYFLNIKN